jgi:hypothetical protein
MSKKPLNILIKLAQERLKMELPITDIPEEHKDQIRAYYEGVIACVETKGGKLFTKSTYSIKGSYHKSWKAGWDFANPIFEQNKVQRKETFKFLKEAV